MDTLTEDGAMSEDGLEQEFDQEFLTCPVCNKLFCEPKILPCLHTFCKSCLEKWVKQKVSCPFCRTEITLPSEGVSGLPTNFNINKLLDFRKLQKSKNLPCQLCETHVKASSMCVDCGKLLCDTCLKLHSKLPLAKDHDILSFEELRSKERRSRYHRKLYCRDHPDQVLAFYCDPCERLVCRDCTIVLHRPGPDHDPREVGKVALTRRETLNTLLKDTEGLLEKLEEAKNSIDVDLKQFHESRQVVEKSIFNYAEELKMRIDAKAMELVSELDERWESEEFSIIKQKEALEKMQQEVKDGRSFSEDVLSQGSDAEVLSLWHQVEDRLRQIQTLEVEYEPFDRRMMFKPSKEASDVANIPVIGTVETSVVDPAITTVMIQDYVECLQTVIKVGPRNSAGELCSTDGIYPRVEITGPKGDRVHLDPEPEENQDHTWDVVWTPSLKGLHSVKVMIGGHEAKGSPFVCVKSNDPVLTIGKKGSQDGDFDNPIGLAVYEDKLIVADGHNERVQVFDVNGAHLSSFPTSAFTKGVAVDKDGNIIVTAGQEVMIFTSSGQLQRTFTHGDFDIPYGVAVDGDGHIVMVDRDAHCVFLFDFNCRLIRKMGAEGDGLGCFNYPNFVTVDREDNIIVSDLRNHRAQGFDPEGNLKFQIGHKGLDDEQGELNFPTGIAVDAEGNVVMAELSGNRLKVMRSDGIDVCTISSDGDKLNKPHGVAVTEDGYVFVADSGNHCIKKYKYL
ncbi:tripartite motif-containing protein 2-like [Branchiostoma lanceolatum]|uniref:tripartite motif-containing protein 2-like n=1 Tax=Branchiostoma lanceolatum TaxID=7740 RepID=UPI0034560D41